MQLPQNNCIFGATAYDIEKESADAVLELLPQATRLKPRAALRRINS